MVTKIVNNSANDITFYTPNINSFLDPNGHYAPIKRVVKAGATLYSRSVTGATDLETYLKNKGCTLSQVRKNLILIVAGQSNAVGYDECAWEAEDCVALPYCYYESLKKRGGIGSADQVPFKNVGCDTFQDMDSFGIHTRTKSIHYEIAKNLIGMIPDEYELEIWGYAYGGSRVSGGNVGTLDGSNLPSGSTKWNSDGQLSIATGKRMALHSISIQPESRLLGFVWCQGENDGSANCTVDNYKAGFEATIAKIKSMCESTKSGQNSFKGWDSFLLYPQYAIDTKLAYSQLSDPRNDSAFVTFQGGTKYLVSSAGKKYFSRSIFRTNLNPSQIEVSYWGKVDTATTASDGGPTFTNELNGYYEVDFTDLSYSYFKSPPTASTAKANQLYVKLVNKLNGKFIGYFPLGGSTATTDASWDINYVEANVDTSKGLKYPLWVVYPGPQKYWNQQGTFKQIIDWQKENFTGFVDVDVNMPTNNFRSTGTLAKSWKAKLENGTTSSAYDSHYGQNSFRKIGKDVANKIIEMQKLIIKDEYEGEATLNY